MTGDFHSIKVELYVGKIKFLSFIYQSCEC